MAAGLDLDALQKAVDGLREEKASIDRDRQLLASQTQIVAENLERFKGRIKLNVGGMKFETTLSTLARYPDSMLGTMFSGREGIEVPVDEEGYVFIDRDGTHFRVILNFLRSGKITFPKDSVEAELLWDELQFYMLEAYVTEKRTTTHTSNDSSHLVVTYASRWPMTSAEADSHAKQVQSLLSANPRLKVQGLTSCGFNNLTIATWLAP